MSSEDWGFDPYADIMEAFGVKHEACRFCKHAVAHHNLSVGCTACTCMATPGEAEPRTANESNARVLAPGFAAPGYALRRSAPADVVDCGVVQHMGLPRMVVGRCIGPMGHRSRAHSYRPVSPTSICGHPHATRNEWCSLHEGHPVGQDHVYIPVPSEYVNHTPAPRKDADMKTAAQLERELRTLEQNEAALAARKAELQAALDLRAALPSEPEEDSVIKFRVQFDRDGIVYTFIAYRTRRNSSAQWYTTGSNTKHKGPHSWDDLLNLMQEDQGVKSGATSVEFFLFDASGKWVR